METNVERLVLELQTVIGNTVKFESEEGYKIVKEAVESGKSVYLWTVGWAEYKIKKIDADHHLVIAVNEDDEAVKISFKSIRGISESFGSGEVALLGDLASAMVKHLKIPLKKAYEIADNMIPQIKKKAGVK